MFCYTVIHRIRFAFFYLSDLITYSIYNSTGMRRGFFEIMITVRSWVGRIAHKLNTLIIRTHNIRIYTTLAPWMLNDVSNNFNIIIF